jgi:hypothetical protein
LGWVELRVRVGRSYLGGLPAPLPGGAGDTLVASTHTNSRVLLLLWTGSLSCSTR